MFKWPWQSRKQEPAKRYAAARLSRYVDFMSSLQAAHRQRLMDLPRLRAHSRELVQDNVYAARYIELVSTNVVGPSGINFESEITGNQGKPKDAWNTTLEESFAKWGKACTTDGRLGWVEAQQLGVETSAADGEILVRLVRGYPNAWGFAIELIDADRLDHTFNAPLKDGARIVGGVEMDAWGRRLAYWIWTVHPDDFEAKPRRVRIPADQILHLYREDRTQGFRGVPWMTPTMVQLNMLGRLWTSELAAANYDADRIGIIKSQAGLEGADIEDPSATALEISSDHATFLGLEAGQDVVFPPSQHPNSVLPPFTAYLLKGVASGLGVAYHSLSGDLAESKFSSDRTALIQERDHWRKLQGWFIRGFCNPIYQAWLEMSVLSGAVKLPVLDLERLFAPHWDARCWDWVDPQKDITASTMAIDRGLSTYQKELSAQGLDWRDVFAQRALEQEEAKRLGLNLSGPAKAAPAAAEKPETEDEEEEESNGSDPAV